MALNPPGAKVFLLLFFQKKQILLFFSMRWYFALDETGAAGQTGEDAKTALRSARAAGGLDPFLLYHGRPNDFTAWMQREGVTVIDTAPSFLDALRRAQTTGTYHAHSIGHWLRLAIPQIEQTESHILYTDCDVIFLRPYNWSAIRPTIFAAAPEFRRDNWNYFNAGVMVLNVPAMRATYPEFEARIIDRISSGAHPHYDDEMALNEAYRGHWDRLDPTLNWKPYWGFSSAATLLHFHGPKFSAIAAMAAGTWDAGNPTAALFEKLLTGHQKSYQAWLTALGDRLQFTDPALALRMHATAAALARLPPKTPDLSFMNLKLFQD
jgi:hypothetical protein